jgi:hypothetical protein
MVGHGSVLPAPNKAMEGDRLIEWIIRAALLVLAVAAAWTVFGDDLVQLLGR